MLPSSACEARSGGGNGDGGGGRAMGPPGALAGKRLLKGLMMATGAGEGAGGGCEMEGEVDEGVGSSGAGEKCRYYSVLYLPFNGRNHRTP